MTEFDLSPKMMPSFSAAPSSKRRRALRDAFPSRPAGPTKKVYLGFHGIGEPPSEVDADERPYWVSVRRFHDILDIAAQAPGKVEIQGVTDVAGEKVFALRFLQARNPEWVQRPFFAKYDPHATWLDQLRPAFGGDKFFFED